MKTICLCVFVAVIMVVLADHSQHQGGAKPGDVVHWTTSNTKGAATLNQTSHAKQEAGPKTTTTTVAGSTTTVTAASIATGQTADEAKPIDQVKVPAGPESAKDTDDSVTTTETSATTAAAALEVKDAKPAEPKVTHK